MTGIPLLDNIDFLEFDGFGQGLRGFHDNTIVQ